MLLWEEEQEKVTRVAIVVSVLLLSFCFCLPEKRRSLLEVKVVDLVVGDCSWSLENVCDESSKRSTQNKCSEVVLRAGKPKHILVYLAFRVKLFLQLF